MTALPKPGTMRRVEVTSAQCDQCGMSIVYVGGAWRHLISGDIECAWKREEQPLGMGYNA